MRIRFHKYWMGFIFGAVLACIIPSVIVFAPPTGVDDYTLDFPPPLYLPTDQEVAHALFNPWGIKPIHVANMDAETMWLARAMFSESKRADEQELIGWTVRNRIESNFRGCTTYEQCVLDPFQYSAFLPNQSKLHFYINLTETSTVAGWQKTVALAFYIRHADSGLRPFGRKVRHFYSEQSMVDPDMPPAWVEDFEPVVPRRAFQLDERRFRFYDGVH